MKRIAQYHEDHGIKATFKRWSGLRNDAKKIERIKKFLEDGGHRYSIRSDRLFTPIFGLNEGAFYRSMDMI